jgi:hypothetical protein
LPFVLLAPMSTSGLRTASRRGASLLPVPVSDLGPAAERPHRLRAARLRSIRQIWRVIALHRLWVLHLKRPRPLVGFGWRRA